MLKKLVEPTKDDLKEFGLDGPQWANKFLIRELIGYDGQLKQSFENVHRCVKGIHDEESALSSQLTGSSAQLKHP